MSAFAIITGSLFRVPEQRTSKTGRPYATATLRVKEGDGSHFIRLIAFSESVQDELLRLADGDAVSIQGAFKAELYGGEPRLSLSIVADQVLALRQPPRTKKATDERPKPERCAGTWRDERDGPNDQVPF